MPTISTLTVDVQARTSAFSRGIRTAAVGLGVLAAGAVVAFKAFEDAEKVNRDTAAAIESTGGAAHVTAQQVDELASAIQAKTAVDDEQIQSAQNMLLTFTSIRNEVGKGNDIFNQASMAVVDLSARFDQDLGTSAKMLGKALNDPVAALSALTRAGVQFTEQQKNVIAHMVESNNLLGAQKLILNELAIQTAGSAEAQATASQKMQIALGELAESVGAVITPAIEKLVGWVTKLAEWFSNLDPHMQTFITTAGAAAVAVGILAKAFGALLLPAIKGVIAALSTLVAHPVVAFLIAMAAIVALVARKWDDLSGVVKAALIVFTGGAVLFGQLIRLFGTFKDAILNVAEAVKGKFLDAWNAVKAPVLAVIHAFSAAIQALIGWIRDAISWLSQLGQGVSSALVQRGIESGVFSGIGGNIPGAASGGFVARSGVAVIHKGETVVPAGSGGGGDLVLQIDGQTFARISRDQLLKLKGSRVSLGLG